MQVLPAIWMLLALLARIAEKAQSADDVVRDDHVVGAEDVDAVAVLAGAAVARRDALDAVAGDDRAVVGRLPAMHQDAAIGAVGNACCR